MFVFHARCGHCKKLAPEYEKLGESFKKAKSVLIGKVSLEIMEQFFEMWRIGFCSAACTGIYLDVQLRN